MKETIFQTAGMSCYTCEGRIKTAMLYVDGVSSCEANCVDGKVFCKYDEETVTIEEIADALRKMDYTVNQS